MWKCIDTNGNEVKRGDELTSFRGEKAKVLSFYPPKRSGTSGYIETTKGFFYPQTYDCKFQKEESSNA